MAQITDNQTLTPEQEIVINRLKKETGLKGIPKGKNVQLVERKFNGLLSFVFNNKDILIELDMRTKLIKVRY